MKNNIFKNINSWLKKPYPFIYSSINKLKMSFGFGIVVFLFLYIFQPFHINGITNNILTYTIGFGLITLVNILLSLFVLPVLFPKFFNPNTWVIGKFILLTLIIFLLISISNWYYNLIVLIPNENIDTSLSYYLFVTIMVGIFPSLIFIYFIEKNSTKKHTLIANSIFQNKNNSETSKSFLISIIADNNKDEFTISTSDLIYISSQGNYASVFYMSNNSIKEQLIRTTLNKIENQLKGHERIIRCHKSYIVNTNHVTKINGNARGYLLKANQVDFLIPVSRNFPKELLYTLIQ